MMLQQGVSLFGPDGRVAFDDPRTVDTMLWYLRQVRGPKRIATDCGWGQPFSKAMLDGVALFFVAPDWRTHLMEMDVPSLSGKLKLMPLPAWEKGGRRTSVWGGTGISITKQSARPDLAWELVKFLYFNPEELGKRFASTKILPPFQDAWDLPEFHTPSAFFSGQKLGAEYARMAPQTPPVWDSPYSTIAESKVNEVFERAAQQYERHGEAGLREVIQRELTAGSNYVKRVMERNVLAGAN
jgi:arabinosaccharide transport system substrate-binding protein